MTRPKLLALLCGLAAPLPPAAAQTPLWTRQLGAAGLDYAAAVAVDSAGNAYITGRTQGGLGGPNAGGLDIFLAKYDASGAPLWTRQFGTSNDDLGYSVAVDGAGNAYIAGMTNGSLGGPSAGQADALLAKYDASGTPLWTRQFGTPTHEEGLAVAVDSAGNASIAGWTLGSLGGPSAGNWDVFLAKYDASGAPLWTRQFGSPASDAGLGVAVDSAGNAYITGRTWGSLGGPNAGIYDAYLAKYDASGAPLWTRQFGSPAPDAGNGVAVDGAGNAYIGGSTIGSLGGPNAGAWDGFLSKYDASGTPLWTRQFGTSANDECYGVAIDSAGKAYITGHTSGSLGGPSAGNYDAFLAKYDASGAPLWTRQLGTPAVEFGYGVALDGAGHAYIAGLTAGSLGGPSAGGNDAFLAKYGPPTCYPNCDASTTAPALNVLDFTCFLNSFAAGAPYANCDASTIAPVLNVSDFTCFLNAFAAGCS